MENESSTKWCELTFVQACPTLENYKKENSIRHQTLKVNKQNLIKTAKKNVGLGKLKFIQFTEVTLWTLTVSFQSPWSLSPRNIPPHNGKCQFSIQH